MIAMHIFLSFASLAFLFMIGLLIFMATGLDVKWDEIKGKKKHLNQTFKCDCGIVSRRYQLLQNDSLVCNHCGDYLSEYSDKVSDNRKFPFAPKIGIMEVFNDSKKETKMMKIKEKLHKLSEYENELESWENLQLKKLQELESKASEIRVELAKSGVK